MSNQIEATYSDSATTIPLPANFPVHWEQPEDAALSWVFDQMHWPSAISPMTGQFIDIFLERAAAVFRATSWPVRMASRRINAYHYHATAPLPLDSAELATQTHEMETRLNELIQNLGKDWGTRYLPEIQEHLAFWQDFDLANATMTELLTHFAETIQRIHRLSELHHLVQVPAQLAFSFFLDLHNELFGGDAQGESAGQAFAAHALLQGFDNTNRAADRALWQLSQRILASPIVHDCMQAHPADRVIAQLELSSAGRDFLRELRAFLQRYGQRSAAILDLDAPAWLDDPTPLIQTLQASLSQPRRDPMMELAAQANERERRLIETRQALRQFPRPVIEQFETLLRAAQTGVFVGEDHNYWIDQCMTYYVRRVMLEFGRRFARAGVIDAADDIFYLTFDEVAPTAVELPRLDRRLATAGRRAEMAYFRAVTPPPALGVLSPDPPPEDPLSRADIRFWGAPPAATEPTIVRGSAASAGVVRGRARVINSLAEVDALQKGDVLVTQTTQPAWTPLFAIAAAVVTDIGGVLSHAAVVAREYGIPAVVGTGNATRLLRSGQMVEVDGRVGVVRILTPVRR